MSREIMKKIKIVCKCKKDKHDFEIKEGENYDLWKCKHCDKEHKCWNFPSCTHFQKFYLNCEPK